MLSKLVSEVSAKGVDSARREGRIYRGRVYGSKVAADKARAEARAPIATVAPVVKTVTKVVYPPIEVRIPFVLTLERDAADARIVLRGEDHHNLLLDTDLLRGVVLKIEMPREEVAWACGLAHTVSEGTKTPQQVAQLNKAHSSIERSLVAQCSLAIGGLVRPAEPLGTGFATTAILSMQRSDYDETETDVNAVWIVTVVRSSLPGLGLMDI